MSSSGQVVTRFAPSPTGYLHIGGARTALFNWVYARGRGGRFHLRIEDTDRARSTPEATQAIIDGLIWLGLDWDGEIVSQAARADAHVAAAERLLASGAAYRDFASAEEVDALKAEAREAHRAYRSPWRDKDPADAPADAPFVVRFKVPDGEDTVVDDQVQGEVYQKNKDLDDLVLLRSDGAPTYNLAVVVDDHDMEITHVIRGDDHLVNAARQTQIARALGWEPPVYAHVPLIHGQDGKKLSKRHGDLGAEAYRDMGYLAAGLRNYLLRLGWSHGDLELFSDEEAKTVFDISGINKAPARLDLDKLASVNAFHLRRTPDDELLELLLDFLQRTESETFAAAREASEKLRKALKYLKERAQTLKDLAEQARFLIAARPIPLNAKARKTLDADALARIERLAARLGACADWEEEGIKSELDAFAADEGVGFGKIGAPLRAALTGGAPAPDLAVVLSLLGRDEALGRIGDAAASPKNDD
ncbi:MAG: glutamate--tRNA ligase [Maricaulaceae bacterium]|jgi:glutamyl-tRNA synthetase